VENQAKVDTQSLTDWFLDLTVERFG